MSCGLFIEKMCHFVEKMTKREGNALKAFKTSGACIIKLITAVIYGFGNKLECLSLNTRLGWKGLLGTNTLAYYKNP